MEPYFFGNVAPWRMPRAFDPTENPACQKENLPPTSPPAAGYPTSKFLL
jgi:hypothetical protein